MNTMKRLELITKDEADELLFEWSMWEYIDRRTTLVKLPQKSAARRKQIADTRTLTCISIPRNKDRESVWYGMMLDTKHYLTDQGVAYARRIQTKYKEIITKRKYNKTQREAIAAMTAKNSGEPNLPALVNHRKRVTGLKTELARRGF